MHYQKYHGIIINRRSLKDADRFLTIYTQEAGKISVYAKGIRSLKSKRASELELFSLISFETVERGGRLTLTHVDLLNSHRQSKTELKHISRLFEIGELVDALTPEHDPHPEIYALLATALAHLSRFETPTYLHRFKLKLLFLLGYGQDHAPADLDAYIESLLDRPLRAKISL